MWAQSYEGDLRDTLALQGRVARDIAEHTQVTIDRPQQVALKGSRAVNPEAYEAYLKGRYFWNKRTGDGLKKAIEYFNHAVELDSTYAEAYSGLADAYALSGDWEYGVLSPQEAFAKAKAAATALTNKKKISTVKPKSAPVGAPGGMSSKGQNPNQNWETEFNVDRQDRQVDRAILKP